MAKKKQPKLTDPKIKRQRQVLFGGALLLLSLLLTIAFISYLYSWKADFSTLNSITDRTVVAQNILNKLGALISHFFIYKGVGLGAFLIPYLIGLSGYKLFFDVSTKGLVSSWGWGLAHMLWTCLAFGYFWTDFPILSGIIGYEIHSFAVIYIGRLGLLAILVFLFLCFLVIELEWTPEKMIEWFKGLQKNEPHDESKENFSDEELQLEVDPDTEPTVLNEDLLQEKPLEILETKEEEIPDLKVDPIAMEIEAPVEESAEEQLSKTLVEKQGFFDPTLELSNFKRPGVDLLKDYGDSGITINQEELEANKNKIVETLSNYKIGIANIKATIGPTVTLYEIVPDAGIRISKIKNLEDDIALSLSALGIRIIAPIPGKGTIGIEVPNQKPSIVSMRSVISASKFQNAEMELPIALGKTISNETFVVDLAKMPHLLMAGATGQGKSVGLNAVLTSLLYKKHPAEVKFVLVDPKKVELNIYNKIERHYLAKLPDTEEAIITDNTKVINTLNSLCIEMDNRYELLKNAMCRNLKEYNKKFRERKLNPNDGHNYLPYIVLVVDEFADLIMTAGKEVETPIARLAQLARAIGIHLIIATQRPSVNVITGIIKANFPARIAFRVTSKIDSRTILDSGGADQLIGRGDMLYTQGNELTRIQCAFVDTPEVEKIAAYVGGQKGYADAHLLPEYVGEESSSNLDIDASERDALFREAAEVIVTAQQGSASLLQRKLKLGYNRAGRIIDQMEAAGVVGPFEGSKARQVLVSDFASLDRLLNNEET
ncbi:DNA translocase FtsK [Flavobacteriaceae bacterium]|nr:DNA translocase FtsK [Flavobacteriaceae bacterium]MDA9015517.1 DNA translocase FtsK [Flavobacteriaceae bacterium]MDB3862392.1 DNA translocase FtsK [Flavobacteriaceae bacterium]MDC3354360.1 DNA translocase FtsK [Flavobacteriaceae bacterium]